jgi:threonine dehydrogenase-like Zn-dependent dehydrogenase
MGSVAPISDKDRIFTNVYGFQGADLKAAQARGDWDKTADLMKLGQDRIIEEVKKLTDGKGCDVVIEAVGLQWPLDLAAELTRERGRLVIAGYHQDGARQVNMQLWNWRGLDVINAHERDPMVYYAGMRKAVEAVASGRLDPSPHYTHKFDLGEIGSAFKMMKERPENFLKALVTL